MQSGRQQLYRPPAPSLSLPSSPSVSSLPLLSPAPPLSLPLPLPLPLPLSLSLSFLSRLSLVTRRHDGLFPPSDSGRGPSRRPGGRGGVGLLSRTPSDGGGGGGGVRLVPRSRLLQSCDSLRPPRHSFVVCFAPGQADAGLVARSNRCASRSCTLQIFRLVPAV